MDTKDKCSKGGIRVPFLMQWKGKLPTGEVYREMVMGFDVHATALAAAGIETRSVSEESSNAHTSPWLTRRVTTEKKRNLDGVNLIPFVTGGKSGRPHDRLFWRAGEKHAVRLGDWKLVTEPREGGTMLFHLADDIGEQQDLAATHPEKLQELRAAFAEWEQGTMPAQWIRQDQRNAEIGGKLKETSTQPAARRPGNRLAVIFRNADRNSDGKLAADEYPQPAAFNEVDTDGDGFATLEEVRSYLATRRNQEATPRDESPGAIPEPERLSEPPLKKLPDSDAVRDAAGRGQLFESIHVAGFTDFRQGGCNGFAIADLNRDGWLDIVATFSPPRAQGARWGKGELLRVWLGEGEFQFREHTIQLLDSSLTLDSFGAVRCRTS